MWEEELEVKKEKRKAVEQARKEIAKKARKIILEVFSKGSRKYKG